MGILSSLFGNRNNKLKELLEQGAVVIDVRTSVEFSGGHVDNSINIPLDQVQHKIKKIKQLKAPLVLCCASGMRSANAANILRNNNIANVHNGGRWLKINRLMNN